MPAMTTQPRSLLCLTRCLASKLTRPEALGQDSGFDSKTNGHCVPGAPADEAPVVEAAASAGATVATAGANKRPPT
jgi:hypothetical protein